MKLLSKKLENIKFRCIELTYSPDKSSIEQNVVSKEKNGKAVLDVSAK